MINTDDTNGDQIEIIKKSKTGEFAEVERSSDLRKSLTMEERFS